MRLVNIIRAYQQEPYDSNGLDIRLDELYALAEAGDKSIEQYIQMLMDGQEPTAQYFGGASPNQEVG
jgi:hypothetical protein